MVGIQYDVFMNINYTYEKKLKQFSNVYICMPHPQQIRYCSKYVMECQVLKKVQKRSFMLTSL